MENGGDKNNKLLMGILGGLLLIIIGLTVGVVIMNINKNDGTDVARNDDEEIVVNEDDLLEGETMEEAKIRLTQDREWDGIKKDIENKVDELLNSNSVDIDAVNKIYNEGIEKATEWNRHDYVVDLVVSRTNKYSAKGLEREALDALLAVDPEILDNVEKYYYYTSAIDLATKLNEQNLVNELIAKRSAIEADFIEQSDSIRRFTEAVGAEAESYVGKETK